MSCGAARAGNRNVWQRGQVVQRETAPVEIGTELSVAHSAFNRGGLCLRIEPDDIVLRRKRQKLGSRIGKLVEAMSRAQYLELIARLHKSLNIFERSRAVQALRAVLEVSSPVVQLVLCRPRRWTGK